VVLWTPVLLCAARQGVRGMLARGSGCWEEGQELWELEGDEIEEPLLAVELREYLGAHGAPLVMLLA